MEQQDGPARHVVGAVVKAVAGLAASYFLAAEMADRYGEEATDAYRQAGIAVEHAITDGRASLEGYIDQDTGLPLEVTPESRPAAPSEFAGSAVAADQTAATVFIAVAEQNLETQRWFMGGAGAVLLLTAGGVYRSVARAVGSRPASET